MIGDSYMADIAGARDFGIRAILVRHENNFKYKYYTPNLFELFIFLLLDFNRLLRTL